MTGVAASSSMLLMRAMHTYGRTDVVAKFEGMSGVVVFPPSVSTFGEHGHRRITLSDALFALAIVTLHNNTIIHN